MTIAAAAPALIERVEPNCGISTSASAAARASSLRPGPSCPNSSTHRSGIANDSTCTAPATLSTATIGRRSARIAATKSATSGWCTTCWYRSVTMAPRRFQRRRPTMCTASAANAFAVRTIDPMFRSCCQFSIATANGCRWRSRSPTIASIRQ